MPISENQLAVWSRQGAIDASRRTHEAIRAALREWDDLRNRDYEVYLQGSYKNSTNIRGSSDVDVIAQMNDSFAWNRPDLPEAQQRAVDRAYEPATHSLEGFYNAVLTALRKYFGSDSVHPDNKAIKIKRGSDRLPADVVVCQQYKKFGHFRSLDDYSFVEGMKFVTRRDRRTIINYPKPHYQNGTAKNQGCSVSYKAGVRIFKNARDTMIRRAWMPSSAVPSYFLECFAYNAANHCYSGSWQSLYRAVLDDLAQGYYPDYICQNRVRPLFGSSYDQ
ncbi:MAG: nucleotidyltransferase [Gammaproteobacteria bacterium]|nr:nucleotidyltransferase [Gammaproteobacteria bacterium]